MSQKSYVETLKPSVELEDGAFGVINVRSHKGEALLTIILAA